MENFVLIIAYLIIGFGLRRVPQIPQETGLVFNQYVLVVALPALVFLKIPTVHFSTELLLPALVPWLILTVVAGLVFAASKIWQWSREVTAALLIALPLGNTSFLGFPMVEAFFGSEGLPVAIIYDQAGSFIALATYSTILAALYGGNGNKPSATQMLKRIATFPSFIALILAFCLKGWSYPPILTQLLESLAATLVPVIMIAVGFQFRFRLDAAEVKPLLFALPVKLLLMPLIALAILMCFEVSPLVFKVTVFEAAMPVMISAGAIAIAAGLAPKMVSSLVAIGLVMSFVTLPMWAWVLAQLH
ncbi:AEC family transporter [Pseudoalteromonas fenneropenaei]|uniref:AEC family transporter n=1 Tax=Pseudoalteromonas fenneropenaei TaxID=1737459 RepID=A0ABV7CFD1_9GAMM